MFEITFDNYANQELLDARDYYDDQQFGLGKEFILSVRQECRRIAKSPNIWPVIRGNIRKYHINRFPYKIYYVVRTNDIFVLAIAHHSRQPLYWIDRI